MSAIIDLYSDDGRTELPAGMCAGFKAGTGNAHRLVNETTSDAVYLEVGDRTSGDEVTYPDDDLAARFVEGLWHFFHKDGTIVHSRPCKIHIYYKRGGRLAPPVSTCCGEST